MTLFTNIVAYTGWIATLISATYIIFQRRHERRQQVQLDELSGMLARASQQPILVGGDIERSSSHWNVSGSREEDIRAALIQAASRRRPLESVLAKFELSQCDEAELLRATQVLSAKGLLEFDAPLSMKSILKLRV